MSEKRSVGSPGPSPGGALLATYGVAGIVLVAVASVPWRVLLSPAWLATFALLCGYALDQVETDDRAFLFCASSIGAFWLALASILARLGKLSEDREGR